MAFTNKVIIDDEDAFTKYGIIIAKDGLKQILQYPSYRPNSIQQTEWAEYDGVDVDLTNYSLNSREITLTFIFTTKFIDDEDFSTNLLDQFTEDILDGSYHTFEFPDCLFGKYLRFSASSTVKVFTSGVVSELGTMINAYPALTASIKFIDDFPQTFYQFYDSPVSTALESITRARKFDPQSFVSFVDEDGVTQKKFFYEFNIRMLKGSLGQLFQPMPKKSSLVRTLNYVDGDQFIGVINSSSARTIKIELLFTASSYANMYVNYLAFFYYISRQTPITLNLYRTRVFKKYKVFYMNSTVKEFYYTGKPWLKTELTFQIIQTL